MIKSTVVNGRHSNIHEYFGIAFNEKVFQQIDMIYIKNKRNRLVTMIPKIYARSFETTFSRKNKEKNLMVNKSQRDEQMR